MDAIMQNVQLTFMALLLAHLLADFPLQPDWIVRNKGRNPWALGLHGLVHWSLAWTCLLLFGSAHFLSWRTQALVAGYLAAHLLIDELKYSLNARGVLENNALTFSADQVLHVLTIAITTFALAENKPNLVSEAAKVLLSARLPLLEIVTVYLGVVVSGGYLIRYLTKGFRSAMGDKANGGDPAAKPELKNAGLYIGYLERLLILTAILTKSATLVGLILTGKSIARLPEFKKPSFAEYFLIGTLLSVFLAVLGGLLLQGMLYGSIEFK